VKRELVKREGYRSWTRLHGLSETNRWNVQPGRLLNKTEINKAVISRDISLIAGEIDCDFRRVPTAEISLCIINISRYVNISTYRACYGRWRKRFYMTESYAILTQN